MDSDLVKLAYNVLGKYDVKAKAVKVIQSGGIKTVWKLDTFNTPLCLKRLRHPLDKVFFNIMAQDYMARTGAKVPAIIPAKNGELYTILDDQVFVLYEWVNGQNLNLSSHTHLEKGLHGLAEFHLASAGYVPPDNCRTSSKLGRWPHHYSSMLTRFGEWKQTAAKASELALSRVFLSNVDRNIELGQRALAMLEKSYYAEWVSEIERKKLLCHQDFGDGNALITPKGVYVIDLDGVTFDIPIRDLRKIIVKQMASMGRWDGKLLKSIIQWYGEVNPLTHDQLQVLAIDLLFPHEFHDTAKNPYRKNKPVSADKLARAAKFELGKEQILAPYLVGLT